MIMCRGEERCASVPHPGLLAAAAAVAALLQEAVERQIDAGTAPDPFRGIRLDESDAARLLARPSTLHASPAVPPFTFDLPPEVEHSSLGTLCTRLGLDRFEAAVLALCLLPEIDGRYGPLIGFVHDDVRRKQPSVELTLTLLAPPGPEGLGYLHYFRPDDPLLLWGLIELQPESALVRRPLALDPAILWYLLDDRTPSAALGAHARLLPPSKPDASVPQAVLDLIRGGPTAAPPHPLVLCGEDSGSCLAVALSGATLCHRPLLLVDGAALAGEDEAPQLLARLLRDALLRDWLPCLDGASALLHGRPAQGEAVRRLLGRFPAPLLLLSTEGASAFAREAVDTVRIAPASAGARLAQWQAASVTYGMPVAEPTLRALAETTGLAGPAIDEAMGAAHSEVQAASDQTEEQAAEAALRRAVRSTLRRRAATIALLEPRFTWADLVLPADRLELLHYLCDRVRYRSQVREVWQSARGSLPGVTALFAGEPGTGKSMAAEVVAHDLGLDLCRIDLSQTVSKYIGETEKNLARLFDEAEHCGAVLVFDEADALFGKRSAVKDSHDRYANIETSYLLQRMERYRGLAVLTTNLRANMDAAFTRRITVSVDFPAPTPEHREAIWQLALGAIPRDPDVEVSALARRLELTGGVITNIAVAAAHLAAAQGSLLTQAHLQQALEWEMRKMGRLPDTGGSASTILASHNGGTLRR